MRNVALILGTLAIAAGSGSPAVAQYYAPPPPPPPGYYPPPPPPPPPPRYYRQIGANCEVFFSDPYGRGHRRICPIVEPKPIGRPCACPGPGPGGYVGGRTIR